jgi:uncharacterized membrane protein YeiB
MRVFRYFIVGFVLLRLWEDHPDEFWWAVKAVLLGSVFLGLFGKRRSHADY